METLLIIHYHLRPGGVRSVITAALPNLLAQLPKRPQRIVVACGEGDSAWEEKFCAMCRTALEIEARCVVEPSFGYLAEQSGMLEHEEMEDGNTHYPGAMQKFPRALRQRLDALLEDVRPSVIWAHNLSVGRNAWLGFHLGKASQESGAVLICHDHDFWVDGRWQRWPEMQKFGITTLAEACEATFPIGENVLHLCVDPVAVERLRPMMPERVFWTPNPLDESLPTPEDVTAALEWKSKLLGVDRPLWLMPGRALRRKNLLEAVLLGKLLRPEAALVLTGAASSPEEKPYFENVVSACEENGMAFFWDVAAHTKLPVPALISASDVMLQTSVQEGFGLTALDACRHGKPLILRRIPNTRHLEARGCHFGQVYADLRVPGESEPFSRLSVADQRRALLQISGDAWIESNPFLLPWRTRLVPASLAASADFSWPDFRRFFSHRPAVPSVTSHQILQQLQTRETTPNSM